MELKIGIYAAIGARIRAFRHKRGMTSERLAELADTSKANISHIETNNTKLSLAMLVRIAQCAGRYAERTAFRHPFASKSAIRTAACGHCGKLHPLTVGPDCRFGPHRGETA